MIQSGERQAAPPLIERVTSLLHYKVSLLLAEVLVGSPDLARLGLVGLALAIQTWTLNSPGHFRPAGEWYFAVLVSAGTMASLVLSFLVTMPVQRIVGRRSRQTLAAAALAILALLSVYGLVNAYNRIQSMSHGPPYNNDGAVMDLYAAQQVRHGHNPYLKTSIVPALADLDAPAITTTPLMRGQFRGALAYPSEDAIQQVFLNVLRYQPRTIPAEFESKYNYPAGSFLFILPFVWAGLHDMRFLYALAVVGMGLYLRWRLPIALRPLAPLLLLSAAPLLLLTVGGQPDPLYGLFLMVGYAEWSAPWLSPAAMGLAVGTKQLAWFFVPFYLIMIARHFGWREAMRRAGIVAAVFFALNAPFILQSPNAYVSSIAGPMSDPMFPLGMGIIALFVSNVLPMLPKAAFTLAEFGVWTGSALAFLRTRYLTSASGIVLAALPLFFAWRSLVNYFYLVPLLALAAVLAARWQRAPQARDT